MRSAKSSKRTSSRQSGGKPVKRSTKRSKSKSKGKKKSKSKLKPGECYCLKCKKGVTPNGGSKRTLKNGSCAMTGTCPHCATKVFTMCKC
jgi:hypothetical protein